MSAPPQPVVKRTTSSDSRKRSSKEIEDHGELSLSPCLHCLTHNTICVVMAGSRSTKCASCARKGIKCVDMSWENLDKTREETKAEIDKDMEELEKIAAAQQRVLARLNRRRKVLKLAEERAKIRTICLLDELERGEEIERVKNGGLSDGELKELANDFVAYNNASEAGAVWSAWDVPGGTIAEPPGSRENASEVPRYFPPMGNLSILHGRNADVREQCGPELTR
jgi:hypothetical protein